MRRRDLLGLLLSLPFLRRWKPVVTAPYPMRYYTVPMQGTAEEGYRLYITDSPAYSFGFTGFNEADRQTYCPEASMEEIERDIAETGQSPRPERQ